MNAQQKITALNQAAKQNLLIHPFVIDALDYYSTQVLAQTDSDDVSSIVSPRAWKEAATTVKDIVTTN